ncbi:ESF1 homolog isoform X2 [Syngnathus scovelli]|uniref:ESF1 homolog isoform X2 n=2 Tax=Syngnathus scovelli TaxID=161590 RepID=UPI00210FB189|nr:ESF1 homolog isoform X3 [Syngnathus scovelli]
MLGKHVCRNYKVQLKNQHSSFSLSISERWQPREVGAMSGAKKEDGAPADERFSRVKRDPRFWEMPDHQQKISIDKRFTSMFHDERFKIKSTVDKRGRPVQHSTAEDLRRFYQISDDEDEDDDEEQVKTGDEDENEAGSSDDEEDAESGLDSSDDSGPDLARGKGNVETSSDEEDEAEDFLQQEDDEIQHDWGELCKDAERSEQVWRRLAICNVDWDRLKAKDLLAILNSFKPEGGVVLSVKIYPSEFGKERLQMEESQGPPELRALPDDSEDDTQEDRSYREKKRDYQFKRLKYFYAVAECDSAATAAKIYQECDGFEYESSCSVLDLRFIPDDMTFEDPPKDVATDVNLATYTPKLFTSSASATSKVDLTWDETDPERVSALQRKFNKNELLDMDFRAYLASSSSESEDADAEEEKEDEGQQEGKASKDQDQLEKYRRLLQGLHDKESKEQQEAQKMEMEVTWVPGLKEATEQLVKKKLEKKQQQQPTPWEEFLQKKRDKKAAKKINKKAQNEDGQLSDDSLPDPVDFNDPFFRQELTSKEGKTKDKKKKKKKNQDGEERTAEEQQRVDQHKAEMSLLMDEGDEDERHKHFNYDKLVEQQNLSKKKKKKLIKKGNVPDEDNFQVDVSDPRFQAVFTSHLFNLDPSHPSYKRTRATQSILDEKRRRREEAHKQEDATDNGAREAPGDRTDRDAAPREPADRDAAPEPSRDASLSLLIKSIKSKTRDFQARKKAKIL